MRGSAGRRYGWLTLSFALLVVASCLVFLYAPTEREMGAIQRIFYIMVPMGWLAMLSSLIVLVSSILYLARRSPKWDNLAHSSAEIGFITTTLTMVTGVLWMLPVWGTLWTSEPRLMTTLFFWLAYLAYLLVHHYAAEESRGLVIAAVIGIIAFANVPIIGLATTLWRGMHPPMLIFQGGLAPKMLVTLLVNIVAYTVLYVVLLRMRILVGSRQAELRNLRGRADG